MSEALPKSRTWLDPAKEAQAVAALRESLRQIGEGDDDALLADSIEGETNFLEAIDKLLMQVAENAGLEAGAKAAATEIACRAERFAKRSARARALIEQAMMIAELDKLERPAGTLTLARRAPSVRIETESEIPTEFWKAGNPKLDRKALLAALKEGRPIPGATLSNAAPSLTIRSA